MNLLTQPWIKVVKEGEGSTIAVDEITVPGVTELAFTRMDFNGGIYQMLIGLLQTALAPKNVKQWKQWYYQPPSRQQLSEAFAPHLPAFEMHRENGPAFMQDLTLDEAEYNTIASLLLVTPGGKTLKDNTDHFIKRGVVEKTCPSCTAAALYCMQSMSSSGGVGYRTSLRGGGGGLATLIIPDNPASTLWQKLWLNVVVPSDESFFNTEHNQKEDTFPWLCETPTSEKKGSEVLPNDVNPLQMFWGMPRRIRLDTVVTEAGYCDLCGAESEINYTRFKAKNYGINYGDGWSHTLTPYRHDPKNVNPPLSIKGKQGGLSYKDWLGLVIGEKQTGETPATVVQHFLNKKYYKLDKIDRDFRLWCFGYDMDNAKVRCWYEHTMPLVDLSGVEKEQFMERIEQYLHLARETAMALRKAVKEAWSNRPKDIKGDISKVDNGFWQSTERDFFKLVAMMLADQVESVQCDKHWRNVITHQLNLQFEHWALDKFTGDRDLPRIMSARQGLHKKYYSLDSYKKINQRVLAAQKEETV